MKINTKKISKFLKSLTDAEYRYLIHTMRMAQQIRELILENNISDERACELLKIEPEELIDYTTGKNYDTRDMANLNVAYITLAQEANLKITESNVPVKVGLE